MVKALLLIDLQNDFMPGGAIAVPDAFACIQAANFAQKHFKVVIATKDWHPPNHLSFASRHEGGRPRDVIELFGMKQILWPDHCIQHTFGGALAKSLDQSQIQHVVTKGQDINLDSYSAFFDNAHRNATGLGHYLNQRSIDEIYLLGVALEYCIKYSAIDAINLGLKTNVIIDGCRGIDLHENDIALAKTEMLDHGVRLLTLSDLADES